MGTSGVVVVYLASASPLAVEPEEAVRRVARALEVAGLVRSGSTESLSVDTSTTFATEPVIEEGLDQSVAWSHLSVDPADLTDGIRDLVYAATEREFWSRSEKELSDRFAVPFIDVTAFSRPVRLNTDEGEVATPLIIEFSYEDARLNYIEIHTIRNDYHQFFGLLAIAFGVETAWTVVVG